MLFTRLPYYRLTASDLSILYAIVTVKTSGKNYHASLQRLADTAKKSLRHVQRLMHGYTDKRAPQPGAKRTAEGADGPVCWLGLIRRGIVAPRTRINSQGVVEVVTEGKPGRERYVYDICEDVLQVSDVMRKYIPQPKQLRYTPAPQPRAEVVEIERRDFTDDTGNDEPGEKASGTSNWTQRDFDTWDYRKLAAALTEGRQSTFSEGMTHAPAVTLEDSLRYAARRAGIPLQRAVTLIEWAEQRSIDTSGWKWGA